MRQLSLVSMFSRQYKRAPISVTISGASNMCSSSRTTGAGPFDIFVSKVSNTSTSHSVGSLSTRGCAHPRSSTASAGVREEPTAKDRIRAAEDLGIKLLAQPAEDLERFLLGRAACVVASRLRSTRRVRPLGPHQAAARRWRRKRLGATSDRPCLTVTGFWVHRTGVRTRGPEAALLPGAQAEAQRLDRRIRRGPVSGGESGVREMLESSEGSS